MFGLSVASAQAYISAATSGTMALTGIVFAMAFVMVQFSAIAYSLRLVMWVCARSHAVPFARVSPFCALCAGMVSTAGHPGRCR